MTPLVFIHGWGMNSAIWEDVIKELASHECHTIDLGFIKGGETSWITPETPAIYIGHSLGSLWFLNQFSQAHQHAKAFISVAGFTNFMDFTDQTTLEKMQQGLKKKAELQMMQFWRAAGYRMKDKTERPTKDQITPLLNIKALQQGLIGLKEWQGREAYKNLNCPAYIIASKNDKIVPEKATHHQWNLPDKTETQNIIWHETSPHSLPQQHPLWLAGKIKEFIDTI